MPAQIPPVIPAVRAVREEPGASLKTSGIEPGFRFPGQWEYGDSGDLQGGTAGILGRLNAMEDNWNRSYGQRWGRYTQPDPLPFVESREFNPYRYAFDNPLVFDDPFGLRSQVCCRSIPATLFIFQHCYIHIENNGRSTTCGLVGGLFSRERFATGRILADNGFDSGGSCGDWNDSCGTDKCVVQTARQYANPSEYRLIRGPNSNTFAATISGACGLKPPPVAGTFFTPGWHHPPAGAKQGRAPEASPCYVP